MGRVLLVLICTLALAGSLWFATAGRTPRARSSTSDRAAEAREEESAQALADLARSEEAEADDPSPDTDGSREAAASTREAELARAQWIDGRVLFPPGTPADEDVYVTAEGLDRWTIGERRHTALAERNLRVRVGRDGSFRVAFHEKARKGRFALEARYLYLDDSVYWKKDESTGTVVLEPKLGARIVGRVRLPPGADEPAGWVMLRSIEERGNSRRWSDRQCQLTDLAFSFDAVAAGQDPGRSFELELMGRACIGHSGPLFPRPGETIALELEPRPGVTLSGFVRDESGVPLEHVRLSARVAEGSPRPRVGDSSSAKTAADGSFRLGPLGSGRIRLQAERAGFAPFERELGPCEEGATRVDLELVLARGGSISGTVRWPDGSPARALVTVSPVASGPSSPVSEHRAGDESGADGAFKVGGLAEQLYRVTARATRPEEPEETKVPTGRTGRGRTEGRPTEWSAEAALVEAGTTDLVLTLSTGLSLAGRVVDESGAPLADFEVMATRIDPARGGSPPAEQQHRSFEGTDGSFVMGGFLLGRWELRARSPTRAWSEPVSVALPSSAPVELVVPRGTIVSGQVLDPAGAPLAGASVQMVAGSTAGIREAQTDEHGSFRLRRLAPGILTLQAFAPGFAPSEPRSLELSAGESVTGFVLQLRAGGTILGELLGSGGRPQDGRTVRLEAPGFRAQADTDDHGRFEAGGVPPGEIAVSAETVEGIELRQLVTLTEGQTVRVLLAAPPGETVRLHGRVRAAGEALAQARLRAQPADDDDQPSGSSSSTESDDAGEYELTLPGPGRYWLMLQGKGEGSLSWRRTADIPEVSEFELDLVIPLGRISGRITDSHGQPLAGIDVESEPEQHEGGVHGSARAVTDGDGHYELLVPPGRHAVRAGGWTGDPSERDALFAEARIGGLFVTENGHRRDVDLRLDSGGILAGVVRFVDGSPVGESGVFISVEDHTGMPPRCDASGRFRIRLSTGAHDVRAYCENTAVCEPVQVDIAPGATQHVELTLLPARRVLLTVTQKGTPVGCDLQVVGERGERQRIRSSENGKVWLGPLLPGRYTARAQRDGQHVELPFELVAGVDVPKLELVFE